MDMIKINSINAAVLIGALNVQDIYYIFGAFMLFTVGLFNIFKIIQMYRKKEDSTSEKK